MITLGPICCETQIVNSIFKMSVVLHSLLNIRDGLFRVWGVIFVANQGACLSLSEGKIGRQGVQEDAALIYRLGMCMVMNGGANPSQWGGVS